MNFSGISKPLSHSTVSAQSSSKFAVNTVPQELNHCKALAFEEIRGGPSSNELGPTGLPNAIVIKRWEEMHPSPKEMTPALHRIPAIKGLGKGKLAT